MKLYLALLESSHPEQTRIFAEIDGKLIDLNLAYAALLAQSANDRACAYEPAGYYFPRTLAVYLERGEPTRKVLDEVAQFAHRSSVGDLPGPAAEKIAYNANEVRLLPPLQNPEKSIVIGSAGRGVDLHRAYAAYLRDVETSPSAELLASAVLGSDMVEFLKRGEKSMSAARKALAYGENNPHNNFTVERQRVRLMAPVPRPGALVSAGKNFSDHVSEMSSKSIGRLKNRVVAE